MATILAAEAQQEAVETGHSPCARLPWVSFVIITVMVTVAILAPVLAPHSPTEQSLPDKLKPPAWQDGGSSKHLLGTDVLGRDMLSRLIYGARVSLTVARANADRRLHDRLLAKLHRDVCTDPPERRIAERTTHAGTEGRLGRDPHEARGEVPSTGMSWRCNCQT